jgi:hypothetical protein
MIGPPLRKFSTKKFLSKSLCGVPVGLGEGEGEVATGEVVVVAGDIPGTVAETIGFGVMVAPGTAGAAGDMAGAVAGDMAAGAVAGDMAGAVAGLIAVVGGAPGGLAAGDVAGGGWPNEVSARVKEQRLAISSVFIGLIKVLSRPRIPMSWVSS